ncbi:MAG: murein biosynthesis integral membrane protein MurJ [Candidatus Moraniibacteriota bacterium]|nr:MAG: murein biosynthesis integral membrane protein MurJ [Candidatus Moranbacteria bacterium]
MGGWLYSIFRGKENHTVSGAALVIAVFGVASRLLGFIRDRLLAGMFGAGDVLDAYYAAFRIPDFLYGLLIAGALSAAFVPIFTEVREKRGDEAAWKLSSGILFLVLFILGGISLLAILAAESLVRLLVPGFSPEKQALTTMLTRIMLLGPVFLGVSAVFGSVLVSFRNFFVFSLAPVFYNVGIITGVLLFSKLWGPAGLAFGVVFGTLLHAAIQYPSVRSAGFRIFVRDGAELRRDVWRVVSLMIPRSLGVAVGQVSFVAVTFFASALASGTLASFTLANNIQSVPLGLFGVAFSLAAFPTLSAYAAREKRVEFAAILEKTCRQVLFFVVPVSVLMLALRAQIVRIILGTGEFDWEDTRATFDILGALSISLFAQSLTPLFARAFFSLQDTKTPLLVALVSEAVHIAVLFFFVGSWGPVTLAISFSVASIVNAFLLFFLLKRRMEGWGGRAFFFATLKMALASLVALGAVQSGKFFFAIGNVELDTFAEVLLQLLFSGFLGVFAFLIAASLFRVEEVESVRSFLVSRFLRNPGVLKEAEEESNRGTV